MKNPWMLVGAAALLVATGAYAVSEIARSVAGSGGIGGSSSSHTIRSTLGQGVAGTVAAPVHTLRSGFWSGHAATVGVEESAADFPEAFGLYPNQPNPFAGATEIHYDVPREAGRVRLRIYNVEGRLVRTLVDRVETPGQKQVIWDGRDDQGNDLSLGVYLCAFEAPGYLRNQKLILMR